MPAPWLLKFASIEDDARSFLETFCRQFPPGTVDLRISRYLQLTPTRSGAAPISITVSKGDPTVVVEIGREAILEWLADLEAYDASWWPEHVEPIVAAVPAGKIKQVLWFRENDDGITAVDTEIEIEGRVERFSYTIGLRGIFARLRDRIAPPRRAQSLEYVPWVAAV